MKNKTSKLRQNTLFLIITGIFVFFAWLNISSVSARSARFTGQIANATSTVSAAPTQTPAGAGLKPAPAAPQATAAVKGISPHASGECLACHGQENLIGKTSGGETISLSIVPIVHKGSFHNQEGMSCKICHEDQIEYPHKNSPEDSCFVCHWQMKFSKAPDQMIFNLPFEDARAVTLDQAQTCAKCHTDKAEDVKGSAHTRILNEGNRFAPVCVDCHNGHDITAINRLKIAQVCSKCHQAEYLAYKGSIHGSALEKESNPDVPTCFDCHGAHKTTGPRQIDFRSNVAENVCGKCHTSNEIMGKYGISTDVMSTYMDDVHGRTDLLGRLSNTSITKATCYDCHGIHNILSPKNPYSKVYPENLQQTCQQCHKDASITFPEAWLSHKKPTLSTLPGLYLANMASLVGVLLVIAVVLVFIILDIRRREGERTVARPTPQVPGSDSEVK